MLIKYISCDGISEIEEKIKLAEFFDGELICERSDAHMINCFGHSFQVSAEKIFYIRSENEENG